MQARILPHLSPRTGRSIAGWVKAMIYLAVMKRRNSPAALWLTEFGCVSTAVSHRLDHWHYKWAVELRLNTGTLPLSLGHTHSLVCFILNGCICVHEVFSLDLYSASWAQMAPFNCTANICPPRCNLLWLEMRTLYSDNQQLFEGLILKNHEGEWHFRKIFRCLLILKAVVDESEGNQEDLLNSPSSSNWATRDSFCFHKVKFR